MSRHEYIHPALREIVNVIAPLTQSPSGEAQPSIPTTKGLRNLAQHAYQLLIELTALHAPPEGYSEAAQLPPLTNRARAVILRANPDALNDFNFEPGELADVLEGSVDARLWVSAITEGALRRWLFLDVVAELEADAQVLRENAADAELRRSDLL